MTSYTPRHRARHRVTAPHALPVALAILCGAGVGAVVDQRASGSPVVRTAPAAALAPSVDRGGVSADAISLWLAADTSRTLPAPPAAPAAPAAPVGVARVRAAPEQDYDPRAVTLPGEVPPAARSAYERAASTLEADLPGCGLEWTLLAAVARIATDHGGDSTAGPGRRAAPVATGRILRRDGRKQRDTDRGTYDGDRRWDRPVGPFALPPSTWVTVAVDADDDGVRDPHDLDDAALATGLLLCRDGGDLTRHTRAARALAAFNGAPGYADDATAIAHAYEQAAATAAEKRPVQDGLVLVRLGPIPTPVPSPTPSPTPSPAPSPSPSPPPAGGPAKGPAKGPQSHSPGGKPDRGGVAGWDRPGKKSWTQPGLSRRR